VLVIVAAGCNGDNPTSPSGSAALAARGERFDVTGIVSDDAGRPLEWIVVTVRYWLGGLIRTQAARTDSAGAYGIPFTANPWVEGGRSAAARAELVTSDYEWYQRTIFAIAPQVVENFRLHPLQRIVPGESALLSLAPDDGLCVTELSFSPATVCRTIRVTAQAIGTMTVRAISQGTAGQPLVSVCCVSGNDRGGTR
jgi:hypothetical protein